MDTSVAKFLWKYAKKLKVFVAILFALVIFSNYLFSLRNYLFAKVIGLISDNPRTPEVYESSLYIVLFIFGLLLLQSSMESLKSLLDAKFMPYYMSKVSKDLFVNAHKHSSSFFAEEMSGNIAGKIKTIITNTERCYMHLIYGLLQPISSIVIVMFFIFAVDISLGFIFSALNLFFIGLMVFLKRKISPFSESRAKRNSESTGVMVDSITNFDLVKNFGNETFEKKHYFRSVKKAAKSLREESVKIAKVDFLSKISFDFMNLSFYFLALYYWYYKDLSIANVVLLTSFIGMIGNAIRNIGFFAADFSQLAGAIRDGLKLLAKPLEVVDVPNAIDLKITKADIVFNKMGYHYKSSNALFKNFSLNIKSGQKIGLVGRSGSGKSTLIRLLSRYYNIQSGEITIDGNDISKVKQKSLHKNIALIPQDPSLFNRTIMENIRYGNTKACDEEVYIAAKKAFIHDFIMSLPNGYASKVGERGVMLSGGERQRIAIARAILKNAPILILDEATSALDSESEGYIQNSMRELMKGKTVIVIAHRLSTLKEMDKLVVMDKGKIIEKGTHASLLRKKGLYYDLYNMQSLGFLGLGA